jgi:hypothetical protein
VVLGLDSSRIGGWSTGRPNAPFASDPLFQRAKFCIADKEPEVARAPIEGLTYESIEFACLFRDGAAPFVLNLATRSWRAFSLTEYSFPIQIVQLCGEYRVTPRQSYRMYLIRCAARRVAIPADNKT